MPLLISITWLPRPVPLEASAVVAHGPAARALGCRLLTLTDDALARLRGVAGKDLVLVLGASDELPWVDGALYLGRDPAAPSLLVPTNRRPSVPLALFERALLERHRGLAAPIAVVPELNEVVSVAGARTVQRAVLAGWLGPTMAEVR